MKLALIQGFMNVYRSGHFHRAGKPGNFDRHGGDLYPDYASAVAAIEPASHYVATVPVSWPDYVGIQANTEHSKPLPLEPRSVIPTIEEAPSAPPMYGAPKAPPVVANYGCPVCGSTVYTDGSCSVWP